MSIKLIDTTAKEIRPKPTQSTDKLSLFLKTAAATFFATLGVILVLGLITLALVFPRAGGLYKKAEGAYATANKIKADLKNRDITSSQKDLETLKGQLQETRVELKGMGFVGFIPIAAGYYKDSEHLLNAADIGLEIGEKALNSVAPFGSILGFKGAPDDKLNAKEKAEKLVTEVIPGLIPLVDDFTFKLDKINKELSAVNEQHYPEDLKVKGIKVREALKAAKESLKTAQDFAPQVKPLLEAVPEIAGVPNQKTYLILLQNDKELRPTGGFITSYALAKVEGGQLVSTESDDIYQLDLKFRRTELAPEAIQKYIGNITLPIRDSNISPSYKVAAEKFESMYNTIPNMPKVDGVFALDTEFVRTFLEVTGPITTKKTKETFSAENNRLGIPDVVYKLELHAEKIKMSQPDRKGILGELMDAMIDKVMNAKPDEFSKYINAALKTIREKHALFYFHNTMMQDFVEKYNAAGELHDYDKDYFLLNNSNFGGLKGNLYIKQKVLQEIAIGSDGTVTKKISVTLTNPVKADGWLNSIYLNWMRIYVPEGSKLINEKVQKDFTSGVELGKEVYRGYGATYPLNNSVSTFTYSLPFKVQPATPYKMLIQKQPGVIEVEMIVKINSVEKEHFMLREDKELSINY